jgi:predicted nucleic acid-binding protein
MLVLVDTPVWSLALGRSGADLNPREVRLIAVLRDLIRDGRAQLVGPVRQELLSGIRRETTFRNLREQLRPFDEPYLEVDDYEEAARIHNQCRSRGIAGSAIDFLLCAAASRRDWQIFTTDHDFTRYATVLPLKILEVTS